MSRRRRDTSFFATLDAPQWTDLALEQQLLHQQQQQHHHLQPQPPPPQPHDDEMTDAWFEQEHPLHERQSYSGFGFGMDGDDGDGDDGDEHDSYDSSGQAGAVDAPEKRSNGSPSRPFSSPRVYKHGFASIDMLPESGRTGIGQQQCWQVTAFFWTCVYMCLLFSLLFT